VVSVPRKLSGQWGGCAAKLAIVTWRHQIEYRQQAKLGEELAISTFLRHSAQHRDTHYIIARG
jgi:acyl-CoA thioesterase FadM